MLFNWAFPEVEEAGGNGLLVLLRLCSLSAPHVVSITNRLCNQEQVTAPVAKCVKNCAWQHVVDPVQLLTPHSLMCLWLTELVIHMRRHQLGSPGSMPGLQLFLKAACLGETAQLPPGFPQLGGCLPSTAETQAFGVKWLSTTLWAV